MPTAYPILDITDVKAIVSLFVTVRTGGVVKVFLAWTLHSQGFIEEGRRSIGGDDYAVPEKGEV